MVAGPGFKTAGVVVVLLASAAALVVPPSPQTTTGRSSSPKPKQLSKKAATKGTKLQATADGLVRFSTAPSRPAADYAKAFALSVAVSLSLLFGATQSSLPSLQGARSDAAPGLTSAANKWERREARVISALEAERLRPVPPPPRAAPAALKALSAAIADNAPSVANLKDAVSPSSSSVKLPEDDKLVSDEQKQLGTAIGAFPFLALPALIAGKLAQIFARIRSKADILRRV